VARHPATVVAAGFGNGLFLFPAGTGGAQDAIVLGPPFTVSACVLDLLVTGHNKAIVGGVGGVAARGD
jgi:hypothetical protein